MMRDPEKRKKIMTRKERAIRRTAVFLLTAALLQLTGLYSFIPSAGLRSAADDENCGPVRVIRRVYRPDDGNWNRLRYFGANDNALLIGESEFHPFFGWWGSSHDAADCSAPGPYHAVISLQASQPASKYHWENVTAWAFGRVDDLSIEKLEVRLRVCTGSRDGEPVYEDRYVFTSHRESWIEKDGKHYFLLEMTDLAWAGDEILLALTTAYDGAGNAVASCEGFRTDWAEM